MATTLVGYDTYNPAGQRLTDDAITNFVLLAVVLMISVLGGD